MSQRTSTVQYCCWIGCPKRADVVIDHPDHGERTVCEKHANGHEVVRDV